MDTLWTMTYLQMIKSIVFLIGTGLLLYLSRASLKFPRSHGFYRFFAWESILVLFILNVGYWFRDPFSPPHLFSWFLLIISGYFVLHALILLLQRGNPDSRRDEIPLYEVEKTTKLVTDGIYAYIRHPLYSSLLFLAWGIALKDLSWLAAALALTATGFLLATARADEKVSLQYFGPAYAEYKQKTKRFIPFIF